MIHTVKWFSVVNEAEVDVFLEFTCFFFDPTDVGNLISGSSAFSKSSLNTWKFSVHVYWSQLGEFWASLCLHVKMKVQVDSLRPHELSDSWNSPDQNTGVGSLLLLQGILPNQGSHPGLPHCRRILYQLSHKGSPWILEWVAYPFSRGSSWLRNQIRVSCIAGGFFTNWAIREMTAIVQSFEHSLVLHFFGIGMKTDLFQEEEKWAKHIKNRRQWSRRKT